MNCRSLTVFLIICLPATNAILVGNDNVLKQLQAASNLQLEKQFVKQAGREMFNNAADWQNSCGQVDRMPRGQINGLQNILNPQQRLLLGQRQQEMNNWIFRLMTYPHFILRM